jgi:sucrose-6-phosphate hydrolase SacC (GH32 family)
VNQFAFHAAAPAGEWFNDPNALFFFCGRYYLLVQHAADAPEFKNVGWARLTSRDLSTWDWGGVLLAPDAEGFAYSGSAVRDLEERFTLFFTRHLQSGPYQTQHHAELVDGGARAVPLGTFGPAGRNMRDPFVFRDPSGKGWRALIAAPCDWTEWRTDKPSQLEYWRSTDLVGWERIGTIGPWSPEGVMWEVPVLIDFGATQALILSLVDRRSDTADCSVRYWLGKLHAKSFTRDPAFPEDGLPLDLGPDFYAAIPNVREGWPTSDHVVIGWASNWRTARSVAWPGASMGGPLSMPRIVSLSADGKSIAMAPALRRRPDWSADCPAGPYCIEVCSREARLTVTVTGSTICVERRADGLPQFIRQQQLNTRVLGGGRVSLFADGPLIELFFEPEGWVVTSAVPGIGPVPSSGVGVHPL